VSNLCSAAVWFVAVLGAGDQVQRGDGGVSLWVKSFRTAV
jgi:hypothetical protein